MHYGPRNCLKLSQDLLSGKYRLQDYLVFKINDPKPRTIFATRYRDRVVQRALLDNGLFYALSKSFVSSNFACQPEKGLTAATCWLNVHLQKFWKEQGKSNKGWYVQLDVRHYFDSTPHRLLKERVSRRVESESAKRIIYEVIDSFKDARPQAEIDADPFGERGIALGSHLSQLLQLMYLDGFDHFVKERLRVGHYVRYMDDMLMLVPTKEEAWRVYHAAEAELAKLGLQLNPKSKVGKISAGIRFLKVIHRLTPSGGIRRRAAMKSWRKQEHRTRVILKKLEGAQDEEEKLALQEELRKSVASWIGYAKWRASKGQRRAMLKMLEGHLPEKMKLEPKEPAEKKTKPRRGKFTEEQWDVIDEQSVDESWIFEDDDRPQLVVM